MTLNTSPVLRKFTVRAPITAPITPPLPPKILTPPIKAATVPASNRYCRPNACAVPDLNPIITPPRPAQKPEIANTMIMGLLRLIPAASASFLAPPIA